VNNVLC